MTHEHGLRVFEFEDNQVRVIEKNGQSWWVATDVCAVLGHTNPTMAIDRLDADERAKLNLGRQGMANVINEPGLYSLILGSRKPEARAFKRWITHEVIPQIRKTGKYAMPSSFADALQLAADTERERARLAEENDVLETALNISLDWCTVMKYNQEHHMGWNMEQCKAVGKHMTALCRANALEVRKCLTNDDLFKEVNSYPRSAWELFERNALAYDS